MKENIGGKEIRYHYQKGRRYSTKDIVRIVLLLIVIALFIIMILHGQPSVPEIIEGESTAGIKYRNKWHKRQSFEGLRVTVLEGYHETC